MSGVGQDHWFAVHAKRFRESLAALNVSKLGAETFLPMARVEPGAAGPIRWNSKPLFPGYFFARFAPQLFLQAVESCGGVLHVVRAGLYPIPVEASVIAEVRDCEGPDGLIQVRARQWRPGDRVSIQSGPFAGIMGRVENELDDGKRVAVLLETLWHARMVIEARCLESEAA